MGICRNCAMHLTDISASSLNCIWETPVEQWFKNGAERLWTYNLQTKQMTTNCTSNTPLVFHCGMFFVFYQNFLRIWFVIIVFHHLYTIRTNCFFFCVPSEFSSDLVCRNRVPPCLIRNVFPLSAWDPSVFYFRLSPPNHKRSRVKERLRSADWEENF